MPKRKRVRFEVSVEMPDGVTITEMKDYIRDAVGTWAKGGDPEGSMFELRYDSVKVKTIKEQAKS